MVDNLDFVSQLERSCQQILADVLSEHRSLSSEDPRKLQFDLTQLFPVLTYEAILPFVVGVLSGLSVETIKNAMKRNDDKKQYVNQMLSDMAGKEITLEHDTEFEECVIAIHERLRKLGMSREQARKLAVKLRREIVKKAL